MTPFPSEAFETEEQARGYYQRQADRDAGSSPLRVAPHPCGDCAVTGGMYAAHAEALAVMPEPLRSARACRWECHNRPAWACRGAADVVSGEALQPIADCTACERTVYGGEGTHELEWNVSGEPFCLDCYAKLTAAESGEVARVQ